MILHVIWSGSLSEHERVGTQLGILSHGIYHIQPESVHSFVQIIADLVENRLPALLIMPVQIRLLLEEGMQIILATILVKCPGAPAETGFPVVWDFVSPDIKVGVLTIS